MTRIDNPYEAISPKTKYQWHCFWVFEDNEFRNEVFEYLNNLERYKDLWKKDDGINNEALRFEHGDYLLNERDRICQKYQIRIDDFMLFKTRHDEFPFYKMSGVFSELIDIKISEIDNNIELKFKPSISKSQYVKAWDEIKAFIEFESSRQKISVRRTKRKQEADYQLIYAVFRAKGKGLKYPEIHKQYLEGALPNYSNKIGKRFNTPKELNDYYLRNSTFKH